jgi:hypothetical protein
MSTSSSDFENRPEPAALPYEFFSPVHLRWADIDALQHVNNAVYLSYFEQARIPGPGLLGLEQSGHDLSKDRGGLFETLADQGPGLGADPHGSLGLQEFYHGIPHRPQGVGLVRRFETL